MYLKAEIAELAKRIGRTPSTLRRWASQGCDLRSHSSVQEWLEQKHRKEPLVSRRKREGVAEPLKPASASGNGEKLKPPGQRGAGAALRRLEEQEERAYARLRLALEEGNSVRIDAAQIHWLRIAEVLRRLDAGLELARRDVEEMVPKKLACDVALAISDWLRISFMVWLSSESRMLMGFQEVGPFKAHAVESFKAILHRTVCDSLKTRSPIPLWAAQKVEQSWNVSE